MCKVVTLSEVEGSINPGRSVYMKCIWEIPD